jgi:hypothetical protein
VIANGTVGEVSSALFRLADMWHGGVWVANVTVIGVDWRGAPP